jgi:hypothetical protein
MSKCEAIVVMLDKHKPLYVPINVEGDVPPENMLAFIDLSQNQPGYCNNWEI